jgi:hypothetical protein
MAEQFTKQPVRSQDGFSGRVQQGRARKKFYQAWQLRRSGIFQPGIGKVRTYHGWCPARTVAIERRHRRGASQASWAEFIIQESPSGLRPAARTEFLPRRIRVYENMAKLHPFSQKLLSAG